MAYAGTFTPSLRFPGCTTAPAHLLFPVLFAIELPVEHGQDGDYAHERSDASTERVLTISWALFFPAIRGA